MPTGSRRLKVDLADDARLTGAAAFVRTMVSPRHHVNGVIRDFERLR